MTPDKIRFILGVTGSTPATPQAAYHITKDTRMKFPGRKTRRILIIALAVVFALALSGTLIYWTRFRDLSTVEKVDEYPLYTMRYTCDYTLDKFLEKGITDTVSDSVRRTIFPDAIWNILKTLKIVRNTSQEPATACSTVFTVNKKGEKILGRNFDWINRPILLLETRPDNGMSSFSMVDISYLGYTDTFLPESYFGGSFPLVFSPYVAFDGMNEAGLAVGEMAVPAINRPQMDSGKVTICDTHSIRMILDKATTVDEAVALLQQYNILFPILAWHYLIADREGNSSIIEFINGQLVEIKKDRNFQICTNHIIRNQSNQKKQSFCWRYKKAYEILDEKDGDITQQEMMDLMEAISQDHTMWSVVYNMTTGDVLVVPGKKYDNVYHYKLEMRE